MSPQRASSGRRAITSARTAAVLLALSLGAAACGSTETSTTPTLATQVTAAAAESSPEVTSAPETTAVEPQVESSAEEAETAAPAVNLFPDIDVVNIADGATVNLATELGGADQATLLWFFAPH